MFSQSDFINQVKNLATISLAGIAMTISNPLDLVRIRMQTMPQLIEQGLIHRSYGGIIDCIKRVKNEEGFKAFWKGNGANLLRFYSSQSLNFCFKERIRKDVQKISDQKQASLFCNAVSGIFGSWLTLSILYPIQHARNMLSNNLSKNSKTISESILQTIKKKGFRQLYRGSLISFIGVSIFRGTYFGVYDTFKANKTKLQKFGLAYVSSLLAIIFTYPSDTIRRRILFSSLKTVKSLKYKGFLDCSYKVYERQGLRSFYRGCPIIIFQSLSASCVLFSYDSFASNLHKSTPKF